jgi:pyrroline-5-carboxylate reductase
MKEKKIAIIGAGNLGIALAEGISKQGKFSTNNIFLSRNQISKLEKWKEKGFQVSSHNLEIVAQADIIILAVKPYKVLEIIEEIKKELNSSKILISVATGIEISSMKKIVGEEVSIFRAMPNTAAAVSESLTCISGNSLEGKEEVEDIFQSIGETVFITEELMNAATVVGACGIAYVLRFIRAMIQGGIEIGFDSTTASQIVTQTVKGAAELLIQNGLHPEQEIDKVTTPKGCTIVGLNEMEHQGFSSALIKGIKTSFEKI